MELIIEIIIYIVVAILIGICAAWIYLIKSMIETFTLTPYLDKFENTNNATPKVSIILPARNEEKYLASCLDSLIDQDYQNYEIVVIDDSSNDAHRRHNYKLFKEKFQNHTCFSKCKTRRMDG